MTPLILWPSQQVVLQYDLQAMGYSEATVCDLSQV